MGLAEIRLPDALLEALEKVSKETSKPRSYHIKRAIEAYLDEYHDLEIALARLNDTDDALITDEELKKALDL